MGKYDSHIIQKSLFFKAPILSFTVDNLLCCTKRFKIYDSKAADSSDDEDEMDYLSESSGSEADRQFLCETTNCIKIPLDYIIGLIPLPHQKLSCLKSGVSYSSTVSLPINQELSTPLLRQRCGKNQKPWRMLNLEYSPHLSI